MPLPPVAIGLVFDQKLHRSQATSSNRHHEQGSTLIIRLVWIASFLEPMFKHAHILLLQIFTHRACGRHPA